MTFLITLLLLSPLTYSAPSAAPDASALNITRAASGSSSAGDFALMPISISADPESSVGGLFSLTTIQSAPKAATGVCPCQAGELIFEDGFESGSTQAWGSST